MAEGDGWSVRGVEFTPEAPVSEIADLAVDAESAGLDTVLLSCHYNNRDPFGALSLAAERTDTIRLGPAAANPYERHPVTLASQMATLQESSHGRAVFGLGAGDRSTLRNLGIDRSRPLRRVLETMQVARQLWSGDRVHHDGTFQADDAGLNFEVARIPTYIAAQGPEMLGMAGKYADGVLINAAHPTEYAWAIDQVDEGTADRTPARGEVDVVAYVSTSIAEDREAARTAARPPVAFIAGSAPSPVLERHGLDTSRAAEIGEQIEAGRFSEAFATVTPAMIDVFSVAGTPATVTDRFEALGEYVDGVVAGAPLGPDPPRALSLVAQAVRQSGTD
jgi:5,10-methylenetetrahydromethanopterin reductase